MGDLPVLCFFLFFSSFLILLILPGVSGSFFCLSVSITSFGLAMVGIILVGGGGEGLVLVFCGLGLGGGCLDGWVCWVMGGWSTGWLEGCMRVGFLSRTCCIVGWFSFLWVGWVCLILGFLGLGLGFGMDFAHFLFVGGSGC